MNMPDLIQFPGYLIRRMHQTSVAAFVSETSSAGYDLTPVQFGALYVLRDKPGIDQATLAELIDYDRVTIGGVVSRLEGRGYVRRSVSKSDRRARELNLTRAGAALLDAVSEAVGRSQEAMLRGLSQKEQSTLLMLLRKAIEGANGLSKASSSQSPEE